MVLKCTVLPGEKDKLMKFTQWGKKLKVPFVIYADFAFYPLYQKKVEKTCAQTLWILLPHCECCR